MVGVKRSFRKKGFTLVEVMAAAAVLSISLLSGGFAIYTQLNFIGQIREEAIATLAAQEEIENIRGMAFDNIINLSSSFSASGFIYLNEPTGTVTVDNIYGDNNSRRVSVTVSWHSFAGATRNQTLATLMTRNGINKQ